MSFLLSRTFPLFGWNRTSGENGFDDRGQEEGDREDEGRVQQVLHDVEGLHVVAVKEKNQKLKQLYVTV